MTVSELKPCPFCGILPGYSNKKKLVWHPPSGCILSETFHSFEKWNTRTPDKPKEPGNYKHWLQEILAILHRDGGHYLVEYGVEKASRDAIEKIYDLIKIAVQAGLERPEWISVKDRLPEERADYIVARQDGIITTDYYFSGLGEFDLNGVTHWMPLPTLPESEGE